MILGTAGHIDHGKTTLVRALTGVDTDRLPEEKRRGITIDLGFAPLRLPDGQTVGIVDVPGHEAFVRTMLAGATGIDLALLVIAADEGPMPQTREHLAILTLLGVRGGVIVLTKRDLVDEEWLALVIEDVRAAVAGTALAGAPVLVASGTTGEGVDELRAEIARAVSALPVRDSADLFRMPVDRTFTVRGTGTVATGTVWSGSIAADDVVRILPGDRTARVRAVQVHGDAVASAQPGTRAALSLHGVGVDAVARGAVLVTDASWRTTRVVRADVALLTDCAITLGPRTRVHFHLGTHDVGARVVASGGAFAGGDRRAARVVLDAPIVARAGDRFVLRGGTPLATIGGGVIADPSPEGRRVRPWTAGATLPGERFALLVVEAGAAGLDPAALPVRLGVTPPVARALEASPAAVRAGARLYDRDLITSLATRLEAIVRAHHARDPLEPGASLQAVRSALAVPAELGDAVVRHAVGDRRVEHAGGTISIQGWAPAMTPEQRRAAEQAAAVIVAAGLEPPGVAELEAVEGEPLGALLRMLEREGRLVQVEEGRFYGRPAIDEVARRLRTQMDRGRVYGPAELRDILGVSRKYLIPLLEYCDGAGVTERQVGGRVVRGT